MDHAKNLDMLPGRFESLMRVLESRAAVLDEPRIAEGHLALAQLRQGLADITDMIAQTRREMSGLAADSVQTPGLSSACDELDAVLDTSERAAGEILSAAEQIQAANTRLRAVPDLPPVVELDAIDNAAAAIFSACSFQDLTGQRIRKVVKTLTYAENRVKALSALWFSPNIPPADAAGADHRPDAHLLHGPSADGLAQDHVDALFGDAKSASQDDIDTLFN